MWALCTMKSYSKVLEDCEIHIEVCFNEADCLYTDAKVKKLYYPIHPSAEFESIVNRFHQDYTKYLEQKFMMSTIIVCGII